MSGSICFSHQRLIYGSRSISVCSHKFPLQTVLTLPTHVQNMSGNHTCTLQILLHCRGLHP